VRILFFILTRERILANSRNIVEQISCGTGTPVCQP
jgi:hypothetical protein